MTFIVAMIISIGALLVLQWTLFLIIPTPNSAFFWSLSRDIPPLITPILQGLLIGPLLQILAVKGIYGRRFEADILYASWGTPPNWQNWHRLYEKPWTPHAPTLRVFIWMVACLGTGSNIATVGTYVQVDSQFVRQNTFWAGEKQFPIDAIDGLDLLPFETRRSGPYWELQLRLTGGESVKLPDSIGRFTWWQVENFSSALNRVSGKRIPIQDSRNHK